MGSSVKFVLAIINAFSNKKRGVNFFGNRTNQRGGPVLKLPESVFLTLPLEFQATCCQCQSLIWPQVFTLGLVGPQLLGQLYALGQHTVWYPHDEQSLFISWQSHTLKDALTALCSIDKRYKKYFWRNFGVGRNLWVWRKCQILIDTAMAMIITIISRIFIVNITRIIMIIIIMGVL